MRKIHTYKNKISCGWLWFYFIDNNFVFSFSNIYNVLQFLFQGEGKKIKNSSRQK